MSPTERGASAYSPRDFLLAGVITFCALTYWIWNERPDAAPNAPAAVQQTAANPAPNPPAAQNPANPLFIQLTNEGLRLYQNHDYAAAESFFRKALALSPDSALAYNNLGSTLNAEQKFREA